MYRFMGEAAAAVPGVNAAVTGVTATVPSGVPDGVIKVSVKAEVSDTIAEIANGEKFMVDAS